VTKITFQLEQQKNIPWKPWRQKYD